MEQKEVAHPTLHLQRVLVSACQAAECVTATYSLTDLRPRP